MKPIDLKSIEKSVKKTRFLITVEEGIKRGGFGESVVAQLAENGSLPVRLKILALPDCFIEHGTQAQLRHLCRIDSEAIEEEAKSLTLVQTGTL